MSKQPARGRSLTLRIAQLEHALGLPLPQYQTSGAAGLDLLAAVPDDEPMQIAPRRHALVPTGLVIELPVGCEAQVRPRSGLALKHGITVLNSPGTIDSDYRGEVSVILINHGRVPFVVTRGERIAQLVVARVERASIATVKLAAMQTTARGAGGFGSTGTKGRAAGKTVRAPPRKPRGRGKSA